jgi:carbamoyltransferase
LEWILGIWDGHDAGCALIRGSEIVFAINEERLTRRKLEIGFPRKSIEEALRFAQLRPEQIDTVAFTTADFAKTLSRCLPHLQEDYYLLRRRKKNPGHLNRFKKALKYRITEWRSSVLSRKFSSWSIRRSLRELGIRPKKLELVGHHEAHAASAAFCSGFEDCLVLTIDGIGDGLSGSIWSYREKSLKPVAHLQGTASFGIFFEHVTQLLHLRELEDEGKVMALANYTDPVPDAENPMLSFFEIQGLQVRARYSSNRLRQELEKILWKTSVEQFAYMAQRLLEVRIPELIQNALRSTGHRKLAYAGGVASNVKLNMLLRELPEVDDLFVFPQMGDGGQALGAAAWVNFHHNGVTHHPLHSVYLGPTFTDEEILQALRDRSVRFEKHSDIQEKAAELLCQREVVAWFEGRMEYGPRALGARSILALPDLQETRDLLNITLKMRSWYQPYCPVILDEDAPGVLENYAGKPNPFMTEAYRVKADQKTRLKAVIGIDGTCRPQILEARTEQIRYHRLLQTIQQRRGLGVLLNTSFNLHGEPVVCSPADALDTFLKSKLRYLVMNDYLISKNESQF